MGIYKTYKEAVLASGSVKGIHCAMISNDGRDGVFGLKKDFSNVTANTLLCHPSGYLKTLADFLESGMRLVNGDKYTGRYGDVVDVQTHNLSTANTPLFGDETRFVVKAAAYDTETPEEKEAFDAMMYTTPQQFDWRNGDHCIFGAGDRGGIYVTYDAYNEGHVIYSGGEYHYVLDGNFRKPETPEQREERDRLETAYDLYCEFTRINAPASTPKTFERWKSMLSVDAWLAVADKKADYRKQ